nr:MAG TPA: hypothetical protein [Bacteriophage sp.]
MATEYTFDDLYQALQKLSKEERSLLPLSNLQCFDSIEMVKELARAYERPAAILYKLSGLLQNPTEQRLLQSDLDIEQKEEVTPEKTQENLISKFYKPYKSSAASAWYKA